jgi:pimeloyl-ACP methyl ester carboxylesterase
MSNLSKSVLAGALVLAGISAGPVAAANIVLVHGMNMDGTAWLPVRQQLVDRGHAVTVVQLPMTSIADDIDATRRAIRAQSGPVVLVGHSYGGMVISQAGTEPGVDALVYIAAFQPEVGESLAALNASAPPELPGEATVMFDDGFYVLKRSAWIDYVADGLPRALAEQTADLQTPVNTEIFGYRAEAAAWHGVPSWYLVAANDRTISPSLQRRMAERSGATIREIDGGHLPPLEHPAETVALIEEAARAIAVP